MNYRQELFKHQDRTWVIFIPPPKDFTLSPLVELIDFYNNQIILKSLKKEKIKLTLGEKTLLPSHGLVPAHKLVVIGTGKEKRLSKEEIHSAVSDTETMIQNLGDKKPWVVVSENIDDDFVSILRKNHPSLTIG